MYMCDPIFQIIVQCNVLTLLMAACQQLLEFSKRCLYCSFKLAFAVQLCATARKNTLTMGKRNNTSRNRYYFIALLFIVVGGSFGTFVEQHLTFFC